MRYYIAGPMSNLPEKNIPAFRLAAAALREQGLDVCSPVDLNELLAQSVEEVEALTWHDCMRKDLIGLLGCNAIVLLEGWEHSKGAMLELIIAIVLGYRIYQHDVDDDSIDELPIPLWHAVVLFTVAYDAPRR